MGWSGYSKHGTGPAPVLSWPSLKAKRTRRPVRTEACRSNQRTSGHARGARTVARAQQGVAADRLRRPLNLFVRLMPRRRLVLALEPGHLSLRVERRVPTQRGNAFETHCLCPGRMNIAQGHAYSFISQRNCAQPFKGSRKHSIHSSHVWERAALYGLVQMESGLVVARLDQTVASRPTSDILAQRQGVTGQVPGSTEESTNLTRRCSGPAAPAAELIR